MNNNTSRKNTQRGLSWKELKQITIEQILCDYSPEYTTDPAKVAKAMDAATEAEALVPIASTVLVGIN